MSTPIDYAWVCQAAVSQALAAASYIMPSLEPGRLAAFSVHSDAQTEYELTPLCRLYVPGCQRSLWSGPMLIDVTPGVLWLGPRARHQNIRVLEDCLSQGLAYLAVLDICLNTFRHGCFSACAPYFDSNDVRKPCLQHTWLIAAPQATTQCP